MATIFTNAKEESIAVAFTIASSGNTSDAINLKSYSILGVHIPGSWTTADIVLLTSFDQGVTYVPVCAASDAAEVAFKAAAGKYVQFATPLQGLKYVKVQSGPTSAKVTQSAERTVYLIVKEL